jgi:hypothetical protein
VRCGHIWVPNRSFNPSKLKCSVCKLLALVPKALPYSQKGLFIEQAEYFLRDVGFSRVVFKPPLGFVALLGDKEFHIEVKGLNNSDGSTFPISLSRHEFNHILEFDNSVVLLMVGGKPPLLLGKMPIPLKESIYV